MTVEVKEREEAPVEGDTRRPDPQVSVVMGRPRVRTMTGRPGGRGSRFDRGTVGVVLGGEDPGQVSGMNDPVLHERGSREPQVPKPLCVRSLSTEGR